MKIFGFFSVEFFLDSRKKKERSHISVHTFRTCVIMSYSSKVDTLKCLNLSDSVYDSDLFNRSCFLFSLLYIFYNAHDRYFHVQYVRVSHKYQKKKV